jgi:hypothetical protein
MIAVGLLVATWASAALPSDIPLPLTAGQQLSRSLGLMASSTPERRNTVRVLFYGQSITEQHWWKSVAEGLRKRYPHTNFVIENRAIGGHSSQRLVRTAEADLYPFQPDLLIFHVYGSHTDYETILRRTRERTTADILQMNDHLSANDTLDEPTDPAQLTPKQWNPWMNAAFLPSMAAKYRTEYADVRTVWKNHLRATGQKPQALLKDGVHLNDAGCELMAKVILAYLDRAPQWAPQSAPNDPRVQTVLANWADGVLRVPFTGNRVDLIGAPGATGPWEITIDGKKPSELPDFVVPTRVSAFPQSNWPVLLSVGSQQPRIPESWELTITEADPEFKSVRFSLRGTVTGADGSGISTERFVSTSGRVVIEPADWNLAYCVAVFQRKLPLPHIARWNYQPRGVEVVDQLSNRGTGTEGTAILAHGLADTKHVLEVRGPSTGVTGVRVYHPSAWTK